MSVQPHSPFSMPTAAPPASLGELVEESLDLLAGAGIMFVALAPFALPFVLLLVATALVVLVPLAAVGAACAVLMSPVAVAPGPLTPPLGVGEAGRGCRATRPGRGSRHAARQSRREPMSVPR
jgi:hypothetical protein